MSKGKKMTFNELQNLVVSLWVASPDCKIYVSEDPDEDDPMGTEEFQSFLRGYFYNLPKLNNVQYIEHDGGGEGGGEYCESVIKVDDTFYKVTYSYASYEGFYWDDAEVQIVHPVERMVTFYEAI